MEGIKHYISVAACFARLAVQRQLEYPLFLVSWLIMVPLQWITGIWMLRIITDRFQPLAGWSFPQLAFLYGLSLLSHGLMVVFFIQTWNMDGLVVYGGFDRMFLRPLGIFFQVTVNYVNFIGFFDLIPGLFIFAYGCRLTNFQWSPGNIIKLILVVAGGLLIRVAFYLAVGSIAFFTRRSRPLVQLGQMLMQYTTTYPLSIYPYAVQVILTYIIPLGFISFYPSCEFLGQSGQLLLPTGLSLWSAGVGLLFFVLARALFAYGLKHYESAGS